ncbi:41667_t:CDS:2, partial [Gigaspora margarita]
KSTENYINLITSNEPAKKPFYDPNTPNAKNVKEWSKEWKVYNIKIYNKIAQEKLNLNWIEFCSRFNQYKMLYELIEGKDFVSNHDKNKEINRLIRETIPRENYSNIYSITTYWKKLYDNFALIFKAFNDDNLPKEAILETLKRCSNITINYFQEADKEDILKLTSCLKKICKSTE